MIYLNHAVSLALIYTYRATNDTNTMITTEEANSFQDVVNNNLIAMNSKVNNLIPTDHEVNLDDLFFNYTIINNQGYYLLKDDPISQERRKKYIMLNIPLDVVLASQRPNALDTIGLVMIDGKIIKKQNYKTKKNIKITAKKQIKKQIKSF